MWGIRPRTASNDEMLLIMTDESRRQRWEDRANLPLTIAAVVFLVAYATPILRPDLGEPLPTICRIVTWSAWALFAVDYVARLGLSSNRAAFVRSNLLDLAVVALPMLRPLRLLRLVALLSILNRATGGSMRGRVAIYVAGATSLVLFVASLAVLEAERGTKGATIATFGDALWWAMTTVTTVGYGDRYPITTQGRFIAGGLMLAGIALLGIVTASLASWLIDKVRETEEDVQAATRVDMDALAAEVRALRQELGKSDPVI
jgi:voltage-gated potassium channel